MANTLNIGSSGILVRPGTGTASINGGLLNGYYNNAWTPLYFQVYGNLNWKTTIEGSGSWIVKSGTGTMQISQPQEIPQVLIVYAGTLQFNVGGQANPCCVAQSNTWWTTQNLYINGGTLDLNGSSQLFNGLLTDNNAYADLAMAGGTITNTAGGPAATLTEVPTPPPIPTSAARSPGT